MNGSTNTFTNEINSLFTFVSLSIAVFSLSCGRPLMQNFLTWTIFMIKHLVTISYISLNHCSTFVSCNDIGSKRVMMFV